MSPVAPYRVPQGTSNPFDSLQNEMNTYASRGFPVGIPLWNALEDYGSVPSGVIWGTTNTSAFAANSATMLATSTKAMTFNNIYAVPFLNAVGHGISSMGLRVTTGVATSVAVFGIYDSLDDGRGNFYPGRKLWQSTQITPTVSNTSHEQSPNLMLTPGKWYWAVYHGGTATPTITALAVGACSAGLGYSTGAGAPTLQTHLTGARTYNATLPTIYPSGQTASAAVAPFLWVEYNPALMQTFSRSFPIWAPAENDYAIRGVRLIGGLGTVQSGASRPSVKIKARIVNGSGSTVLGTFDSTKNILKPGVPFYLTDVKNDATPLPKDSILEAYVEQTGWPLLSVANCAVCCDLVRTRP